MTVQTKVQPDARDCCHPAFNEVIGKNSEQSLADAALAQICSARAISGLAEQISREIDDSQMATTHIGGLAEALLIVAKENNRVAHEIHTMLT
ncbi:MAG: hypothetical protein AAF763_02450 [Pseudomonadota bacterium]